MSHVLQVAPPVVETPRPPVEPGESGIRTDTVYVVHTAIDDTLAAVRVAGAFAKPLGVPVTLVHVRNVPYALPVDEPCGTSAVETDSFITRLRAEGIDVHVRVCLCRDARRAIPSAFKSHSLIVVAGRRAWWPTEPARWRRALEAAGHFVVFVDKTGHKETSHA